MLVSTGLLTKHSQDRFRFAVEENAKPFSSRSGFCLGGVFFFQFTFAKWDCWPLDWELTVSLPFRFSVCSAVTRVAKKFLP